MGEVTGYLPVTNNFPGSFFWRGTYARSSRTKGLHAKDSPTLKMNMHEEFEEGQRPAAFKFDLFISADGLYAVAFSFALDLTHGAHQCCLHGCGWLPAGGRRHLGSLCGIAGLKLAIIAHHC